MRLLALFMLFFHSNDDASFVVDASAEITYTVDISREDLRLFVDDIGLFQRHMPGVVAVQQLGGDRYLYQTEKEVPLRGTMSVAFVIQKIVSNDTVTLYRTPDKDDQNWMSCRVQLRPLNRSETSISIKLRLRLSRERGSDVHWLAPLVGSDFISDRMQEDLEEMLKKFVVSSKRELYQHFSRTFTTH